MPTYIVELEDGRELEVEADTPPTSEDLTQYFAAQNAPQAQAAKKDLPFGDITDVASALGQAGKSVFTTVPASFRQMYEGSMNPWNKSPESLQGRKEMQRVAQESEAAQAEAEASGDASVMGRAIRSGIPSYGFTGAILPVSVAAGGVAGLGTGLVSKNPVAAQRAAIAAGSAASGIAAYRMASSQFMDDARERIDNFFLEKTGRLPNKQEQDEAYQELLPLAQEMGMAEALPEAFGNLALAGAGKYIYRILGGKTGVQQLASGALSKARGLNAAKALGAGAASTGVEVGTEGLTEMLNEDTMKKLEEGVMRGEDVSTVQTEPYSMKRLGESIEKVAEPTLATTGIFGLLGAGGGMAYRAATKQNLTESDFRNKMERQLQASQIGLADPEATAANKSIYGEKAEEAAAALKALNEGRTSDVEKFFNVRFKPSETIVEEPSMLDPVEVATSLNTVSVQDLANADSPLAAKSQDDFKQAAAEVFKKNEPAVPPVEEAEETAKLANEQIQQNKKITEPMAPQGVAQALQGSRVTLPNRSIYRGQKATVEKIDTAGFVYVTTDDGQKMVVRADDITLEPTGEKAAAQASTQVGTPIVTPASPAVTPIATAIRPTPTADFASRNQNMLPETEDFGGKFQKPLVIDPASYSRKGDIETVNYLNPDTGEVDVYISAFGDKDFIAYMRQYDANGNPTNTWTSKLERRTEKSGATRQMLEELQARLPQGHQYAEDVSVSTDGLRFFLNQLNQGYEVAMEDGKPVTTEVAISGESRQNDLPIPVDPNGKFENIRITTPKEFAKVRDYLGKMLEGFGVKLSASNVRWENGTAFIDLPVLRKKAAPAGTPVQAAPLSEGAERNRAVIAEAAAKLRGRGRISAGLQAAIPQQAPQENAPDQISIEESLRQEPQDRVESWEAKGAGVGDQLLGAAAGEEEVRGLQLAFRGETAPQVQQDIQTISDYEASQPPSMVLTLSQSVLTPEKASKLSDSRLIGYLKFGAESIAAYQKRPSTTPLQFAQESATRLTLTSAMAEGQKRKLPVADIMDKELEKRLAQPITPQGTPTLATEGTVMPGDVGKRDATKPEQMTPEEFDKSSGWIESSFMSPEAIRLAEELNQKYVTDKKIQYEEETGRKITLYRRRVGSSQTSSPSNAGKLPVGQVGDSAIGTSASPLGTSGRKSPSFPDVSKIPAFKRFQALFGTDIQSAVKAGFITEEKSFSSQKPGAKLKVAGYSLRDGREFTSASDAMMAYLATSPNVSVKQVEISGITLPEGYVRQGDLYVFQPGATGETPVQAAPSAAQAVKATAPGPVFQRVASEMDTMSLKDLSQYAEQQGMQRKEAVGFARDYIAKWANQIVDKANVLFGRSIKLGFFPSKISKDGMRIVASGRGLSHKHGIEVDDSQSPLHAAWVAAHEFAHQIFPTAFLPNEASLAKGAHPKGLDDIKSKSKSEKLASDFANWLVSKEYPEHADSIPSIPSGMRDYFESLIQPQTTAAEKQTPAPSRKGAGAAGVTERQPSGGSIPEVAPSKTPETQPSTKENDAVAKIDRLVSSGAKPEEMDKFVKSLSDDEFNALVESEAFDVDAKLAIKPKDTYDAKRIKRRKFVDQINATAVQSRKTAEQIFKEEEAALERQRKMDERTQASLNSIIDPEKTNIVQGTVSATDAESARRALNNSGEIPNAFLTRIYASPEAFLADRANQRYFPSSYARLQSEGNIEGLFERGQTLIFADKIGVSDLDRRIGKNLGISPEQAAARRVIAHENGHRSVALFTANEKREFLGYLRRKYNDAQIDNLVRVYSEYADWRTNLESRNEALEELFLKDFERLEKIPTGGLWDDIIQFLKRVWRRLTGRTDDPTLDNMKDVVRLLRNAMRRTAVPSFTTKNGGDVKLSLSDRFQGVTPAQDAEYLAAIEAGDMEKAQRMVDEALGLGKMVYIGPYEGGLHPFPAKFVDLVRVDVWPKKRPGSYFTPNEYDAGEIKYLKGEGEIFTDGNEIRKIVASSLEPFRDVERQSGPKNSFPVYEDRFPGITNEDVWALVESADPVTYDDAGNVIPLSQRFQVASPDIRFSRVEYASDYSEASSAGAQLARDTVYDDRIIEMRDAIRRAYEQSNTEAGVAMPLDELYAKSKELAPDMTENEFGNILQDLYEDNGAVLQEGESAFNVFTPEGRRAGFAVIMPKRAVASRVETEGEAVDEYKKKIEAIDSNSLNAFFGGVPMKGASPQVRTVKPSKSYEQASIELVNDLTKDGTPIEDIAESLFSDEFLQGLGIKLDIPALVSLIAEVKNRVSNQSRDEKVPGARRIKLQKLDRKLAGYWQDLGTNSGRSQGIRSYITRNPRYSWMFIFDRANENLEKEGKLAAARVASDLPQTADNLQKTDAKIAEETDEQVADDVEQLEESEDDILLREGESALDSGRRSIWERMKDVLRKLALVARARKGRAANAAKASISKEERDAISQMSDAELAKMESDLLSEFDRLSEAFLKGGTEQQKATRKKMVATAKKRAEQGKSLDASKLEGDSALAEMIRAINQARPGEKAPLKKQIPWRKLLSQKASTVEIYRQRIFDAISSEESLANLNDAQKAKLADLFTQAWESKRKAILDRMVDNAINQEQAAGRLTREGADALRSQRQKLVEDINLGILDEDRLMKHLADKFGIKSEFTEAERANIDRLLDILQDDKLNEVKRNKAAYELLEALSSATKIPLAKLLADYWVSSVLSGVNTAASIAMAVASGAYELTSGAFRILRAGFTNPKELPAEIAASFKAMAEFLKAFGREGRLAWQYLVTGDRAFLDPSMNTVLNDLNYDSIGKTVSLAEKMAKSDKIMQRVMGIWMRSVSRLLTALDSFNSGVTKAGALPIVFRQLNLDAESLKQATEKYNLQLYRDRVIQRDFNGNKPTTAHDKALVDSYAKAEMMADLQEFGKFSENADFFGQQGAMTLDPTGVGGFIYSSIKSFTGGATNRADKFLAEAEREWKQADGADKTAKGLQLAFAYFLQFGAYNIANLAGLRFARFAGNKFNQGLSFIPGIGMLRMYEATAKDSKIEAKDAFTDMIMRNQTAGLLLSLAGFAVIQAIMDEPDDEKRGWFINGGWANLTPDRKQQKLAAGQKEFTIGIGGKVYNYQNWPISPILAAIGSLSDLVRFSPEQWNEKSIADRLVSAAASGVFSAGEIPALSGFQTLFGNNLSSKDPNEKRLDRFAKVMAGWGGGFVPRILKDIDFMADPGLRKYETLWEQTASHIPVYRRYSGEEYYDILGKQIERKVWPGSREFMELETDPEYRTLGKLNSRGIWLTPANAEHRMVGKGRNKRKLTQEEADAYSLETGKGYRQMLLRYGSRLEQMPTERARAFLMDKADEVRDRALKKIVR